jgi:NAD-dependent SIR2 family protein deacetylase
MTSDWELIQGIDGEPLDNRLYKIKGEHLCSKCNRSLKGKTAYLDTKNNLICRDVGSSKTPIEALLCNIFEGINKNMTQYNERIPATTVKKIEKALRDSLEF